MFHLLPHQIPWVGSLRNSECSKHEKGLKQWAKSPGAKGRKQGTTAFLRSACEQITKQNLLCTLACDANIDCWYNSMGSLLHTDSDHQPKMNAIQVPITEPKLEPAWTILQEKVVDQSSHGSHGGTETKCKFQWHMKGGQKDHPPALHDSIQHAIYTQFFIQNKEEDFSYDATSAISGYVSIRLRDGTLYRSHPNYKNCGPWYDWAIIEDPNITEGGAAKDMAAQFRSSQISHEIKSHQIWEQKVNPKASKQSKSNNKKGLSSQQVENQWRWKPVHTEVGWIDQKYHPHKLEAIQVGTRKKTKLGQSFHNHWGDKCHVPAKIVAVYRHPDNSLKALVHVCWPQSQFNYDYSNKILDSWHKQFYWDSVCDENGQWVKVQVPQMNEIPIESIKQCIMVFEEVPGIHKNLPDLLESNHVLTIMSPNQDSWADQFLVHPDSST